jgi:hypothetical protein
LEDINNILNSGEVPNLYEVDEFEKIIAMVRPLAKAAGKLETRDAIMQHYIHLVRENLHIVLCMSPIGAGFRTRCRMFPSLVNCCTIDWFNAWPEDALFSVAQKMFESQRELGIGEYVDPLSSMCNKVNAVLTSLLTTPSTLHTTRSNLHSPPTPPCRCTARWRSRLATTSKNSRGTPQILCVRQRAVLIPLPNTPPLPP